MKFTAEFNPFPAPDPHNWNSEASIRNYAKVITLFHQVLDPGCPTCRLTAVPVPGPGDQWVMGQAHEASCREHEDNQPAAEMYVGDHYDPEDYRTAEAIWKASQEDTP